MIIRDLARYDLNTVVQPGGMSRTDLNLSLRHQCLLRGASEHLWSLKYSSRKFSWGPAQSLYISLPFLESILLYFFRFMRLGAIRMWACQACSCRRGAVQRNSYVPVQHQATMPRATNAGHWVTWRSWKHCWPKYSHWHNECSHWRSSECRPCGQTVQDLEASRFDRRTSIDLSGEWQKGLAKGKYSKQTGMGTS